MLLNRLATGEVTRLYGGLTDFESASRLEPASLDRVGEEKKEKRKETSTSIIHIHKYIFQENIDAHDLSRSKFNDV